MEATPPDARLSAGRRLKKRGVRLLARLAPPVYRAWMGLVAATSSVDRSATDELRRRWQQGGRIVLLMLHQDVFAAPWFLRGIPVCGLASTGDAGDVIDAVMRSLGHRNVRGGTSARGSRRRTLGALRGLIRDARSHGDDGFVLAITPDGSVGPAGACKPGFGLVALETGAEVWCIKIHASPCLLLRTWDRTMLPLPFGRLWAELDGPIVVPADADAASLEQVRERAEGALHRLHARAFARSGRPGEPVLQSHRATTG